jgi:predicted ferric reductase
MIESSPLVQSLLLGDLTGFTALALAGLSAAIMALRARLVKLLGSAEALKTVHVAVSIFAVVFLAIHIFLLFTPPVTMAVDLGYGAFFLGVLLWGTGVGFLERNRGSFFLHGSLAVALIALVVVHAASAGVNVPPVVALSALLAAGVAAAANAFFHLSRLLSSRR